MVADSALSMASYPRIGKQREPLSPFQGLSGTKASEFNMLAYALWVTEPYTIAVLAVQPAASLPTSFVMHKVTECEQYGRLSDKYGRKTLLLVSYVFFGIGNLFLSAFALVLGLLWLTFSKLTIDQLSHPDFFSRICWDWRRRHGLACLHNSQWCELLNHCRRWSANCCQMKSL